MGHVDLYREERSECTEYSITWTPSRAEKRIGCASNTILLTEKEFVDLVNAGLKFVGNRLKVA